MSSMKKLIPKVVRKACNKHYKKKFQQARRKREQQIPKVPLQHKHIKNCELLLNRATLLSKLKKRATVAEIGVAEGAFSKEILEIAEPHPFHLIDIWNSDRYHDGLLALIESKFTHQINNGTIKIHRDFSTNAAASFDNEYFDWIYIDTDHSYETTRDELIRYAPKVKTSGIIAGHDYSMGHWISSYRYGVVEAVHEFCVKHDWEVIYLTIEPIESQSFAIKRIDGDIGNQLS